MNRKIILLIGLVLITLLSVTGCGEESTEFISRSGFLMDTVVNLKIYDNKDDEIIDLALERLKEIEDRMSATKEGSDISLINENAGIKPVKVHDDVYYVLQVAKNYATMTDGAFEPTIGPLVDLWNVNDEERERDSIPTEDEIKEKLALVNYNDLELKDDNYVYLKKEGMKLDLGGIVKGYAADEVKRIFLENGVKSAIIDLGGNIYAIGEKDQGQPWAVGVTNPFEPSGRFTCILELTDSSIITSGDYERYFMYDGKKYHHIIDSKTGYPSESEVSGVSVISDRGIDGDSLSTALFIMGVDEGLELVNELDGVEVMFITKDKEVIVSEGLKGKFNTENPSFQFINIED